MAKGSGAASAYAVELGAAGTFTILSKSGITDVKTSAITGDVGTSPITGAALLISCPEVTGTIFTVDADGPPCAINSAYDLGVAVGDMETAYTDAAGRPADSTELGAGEIGGLTLVPGVYKWSTNVNISTDVTFNGTSNDVWIMQVSGNLNQANSTRVTLAGGALAKNIFWQVAGQTALGTDAFFKGIVLSKTLISVNTHTEVKGRLFSGTAVTLQKNTVTAPVEFPARP
ncbi:DUF3494 domain-containing protein [Colwellia sp. C1TZA3]|nr:DUF3494 domain-containing protein [Colwellia sp. C1TZA3]